MCSYHCCIIYVLFFLLLIGFQLYTTTICMSSCFLALQLVRPYLKYSPKYRQRPALARLLRPEDDR